MDSFTYADYFLTRLGSFRGFEEGKIHNLTFQTSIEGKLRLSLILYKVLVYC